MRNRHRSRGALFRVGGARLQRRAAVLAALRFCGRGVGQRSLAAGRQGRGRGGWRDQLEQDVALLRNGERVWLRADNAYNRGELVAYCAAAQRGWDYSISLTDARKQGPLRRILADGQDWTALDAEGEEQALLRHYQPAGWTRAEVYVSDRAHARGRATPAGAAVLIHLGEPGRSAAGRVGTAAPGQAG